MARSCVFKKCGTKPARLGKMLHRFPLTPKKKFIDKVNKIRERRRRWIEAAKRTDLLNRKTYKYSFVCEDHFVSKSPAPLEDEANVDWVPTLKGSNGQNSSSFEGNDNNPPEDGTPSDTDDPDEPEQPQSPESGDPTAHLPGSEDPDVHLPGSENPDVHLPGSEDTDVHLPGSEDPDVHLPGSEDLDVHVPKGSNSTVPVAGVYEPTSRNFQGGNIGMQNSVEEELTPPVYRAFSEGSSQDTVTCECAECQTDLSSVDIAEMEAKLKTMDKQLYDLDKKVSGPKFCQEDFIYDDVKTRYFTGLASGTALLLLFKLISPHLSYDSRHVLNKFEVFILTLMRMRLNLDATFLAYYFDVSRSAVSRAFNECLDKMYHSLKGFIVWPERHILYANMPKVFQDSFGNRVTVIIDCFEIFIEKPSNLLARAQTWSNYKHHNTVKILIGITPSGAISYISEAYGGRTSDKYVTENCGFLDKLRPRDLVLADRGFTIDNSVSLYCAEVMTPAFTRGRRQLSALDVETTRKIAHVRIHAERIIGTVRQKYTILAGILPIHMLLQKDGDISIIDKIVTVCCALTNLCPSVVSME